MSFNPSDRDRYVTPRVEHDPEVERRDRIREIERLRAINQGPWAIGVSHWNQRDLYTQNSRTDDAGYGRGPATHPEEGSYAYHRELVRHHPREHEASLEEREAWPLLNYTSPQEDPYFAHLDHRRHDSFWDKLKGGVSHFLHATKQASRPDARIREDVNDALTRRGDLDATDIEVTVEAGEVTLTGTVIDRRSKRLAEDLCKGTLGVQDVHNRLTIRKDDPTDANVAFVLPIALTSS